MMAGMAAGRGSTRERRDGTAGMPEMDGTFRIVTDGQILANNTDEGPRDGARTARCSNGAVNQRTAAAPMALIQLGG